MFQKKESMAQDSTQSFKEKTMPILALRDRVIFPDFVVPLFVGRQKPINAVTAAIETDKEIFVVAQKDQTIDDVCFDNLYAVGTVCRIEQAIKLTDGSVKILVDGLYRAKIQELSDNGSFFVGETFPLQASIEDEKTLGGLRLAVLSNFENFIKQNKKLPPDIVSSIMAIEDSARLCDTIAFYLPLKISEKQMILEADSVKDRLEKIILVMEEKSELFQVEKKIKSRVKKQVEKNQKEYYLNEQLKAIYKELGNAEDVNHEINALSNKIKASGMTNEAKDKANKELKKLRSMPSISQEGSIIKSYIDWLVNIPWKSSKEESTIAYAEEVLNKSHYGLEKVKERIMEYLAVQKRVKKMKAQIMCFVGPPGVGKTSLGKAIADATKKSFVRVALGGVNDEAEIRGHRKTYIGAMPGKIIQAMKRAKFKNPVIMLDEIDKLGSDWRGDPASALLEVLDPEQNSAFVDHYIEVPYDLSEAIFITTANSLDIPLALLDRMEIISLSGYTEEEKLSIAKIHIIPKQIEQNGLKEGEIEISDDAILKIIRNYTMESGVRSLEREIAKIARKAVRKLVSDESFKHIQINSDNLSDFLGVEKFSLLLAQKEPQTGVVMGLAWTEAGGDVLSIEALLIPGSGNIISTGKLGEVMQESIKAAYSYVKSRAEDFDLTEEDFSKTDIHIHVPEGAVPKDGPSAGITICTAIVSAFSKKKVNPEIAMTGEITLVGKVLAIGGLKEKLLAARRSGIKKVFIPKENEKDLPELPKILLQDLEIKCVSHIDEVLKEVFV